MILASLPFAAGTCELRPCMPTFRHHLPLASSVSRRIDRVECSNTQKIKRVQIPPTSVKSTHQYGPMFNAACFRRTAEWYTKYAHAMTAMARAIQNTDPQRVPKDPPKNGGCSIVLMLSSFWIFGGRGSPLVARQLSLARRRAAKRGNYKGHGASTFIHAVNAATVSARIAGGLICFNSPPTRDVVNRCSTGSSVVPRGGCRRMLDDITTPFS